MKKFSWFILLVLLLPACQPRIASPTVSVEPPTSAPPAGTPTLTPEPGPLFTPVQTEPIFRRGTQPWFADVVEPGAVIFHDGQFHLFFNGFEDWPAKVAIGYATSPDGITWTLAQSHPR